MMFAENLFAMRGVWHDHLVAYHPDGTPMTTDDYGSMPGPFPYDNLVYVDFDGESYRQTNVTVRGRPLHVRSFTARVTAGVLRFDELGPSDPGHVGVSGGPGVIWFIPSHLGEPGLQRFAEPDHIRLHGDQRIRATTLYRGGALARIMTVSGTRIAATAERRVEQDPRGPDGPVHEQRSVTNVYAEEAR